MTPLEAFQILDLRVGRVLRAEPHEKARKPSYKLWVDLGPLGVKQSSAQITDLYRPEDLVGRLVVCAVNLGAKRVAGFLSEVLVLGVPDEAGRVVLLAPDREVPLGERCSKDLAAGRLPRKEAVEAPYDLHPFSRFTRSSFSLGAWRLSSGSPRPRRTMGAPRVSLSSATTGIVPPSRV